MTKATKTKTPLVTLYDLLTPRQFQIAGLVSEGLGDKEIGEQLGLSAATISLMVSAALDRADCRRVTLATRYVLEKAEGLYEGIKAPEPKQRHGHCVSVSQRSPTYLSWVAMRGRCLNPNSAEYKRYGGRGIKICERWSAFINFLADMGERPPSKTLDRINNDGNYEPGNCRWATAKEQYDNSSLRQTRPLGAPFKLKRAWTDGT